VAAACGAAGVTGSIALRMAWLFAAFHVAMCTLGWSIGAVAERWIAAWDHWVAFGLLVLIGGKMVYSALRPGVVPSPASWGTLLVLAVATSIDAVAAGITLPLVDAPELVTIGLVGAVVLVFVLVAARVGAFLGMRFGRALQIGGGVALIGLGVKIAFEHAW
jgi:putative Mn2+ efflux pump MntP